MNKKKNIEAQFYVLRTILAISIALAIAFVIVFLITDTPFSALKDFLLGPVMTKRRIGNIVEVTTPLLFVGTGVCLIFSTNQTNMAVEGGFFLGAVGASFTASQFTLMAGFHAVLSVVAGGALGALACFIPAILFVKFEAKPVVSSIMVNNICLYMGLAVINHIIFDPQAGYLASEKFKQTAKIPKILAGTNVHLGIIIGIAVIVLSYLYLYKSKYGYEIRVVGNNADFAKYSGIPVNKVILSAQILGGMLAGIGGAIEVLGMYNRFQYQSLTNHGFDGILVGIIARYNPKFVPFTALFLAYIKVGADVMQRTNNVPIELVSIIQGIIIMLVVAERFLYKLKHKKIVATAQRELAQQEVA